MREHDWLVIGVGAERERGRGFAVWVPFATATDAMVPSPGPRAATLILQAARIEDMPALRKQVVAWTARPDVGWAGLSRAPVPSRGFPATNDAIVATDGTMPLNRSSVLIEPSEDVSETPLPTRTPSAPDVRLLEQIAWLPRHPRDDCSKKNGQIQGWARHVDREGPSLFEEVPHIRDPGVAHHLPFACRVVHRTDNPQPMRRQRSGISSDQLTSSAAPSLH